MPRLQEYNYILPQYVSVFFNTQKIKDRSLRALISESISSEKIIKELGEQKFQEVKNHFLTQTYTKQVPLKTTFKKYLAEK